MEVIIIHTTREKCSPVEFKIGNRPVGMGHPTYFIADIAANHDGNLERAIELIHLAKKSGADAAKFQHFTADSIVSDFGFRQLKTKQSHQASWDKSVAEVYEEASLNHNWTGILKETCDKVGIHFFTSPYSLELVDFVDPYVIAYKVGSGDITWPQIISKMASKGKPMLLATGASCLKDVEDAMSCLQKQTNQIVLMQCNTNYTAALENFKYINLNVLKSYQRKFPNVVLGLSDHTLGHSTVIGAITLGARVVEKHFTDDNSRKGPDHHFAMNPKSWRTMINMAREIEDSLGSGIKVIEKNEKETVVVQRRAIRSTRNLTKGELVKQSDIVALRPCPSEALTPANFTNVIGKTVINNIAKGDILKWTDLR